MRARHGDARAGKVTRLHNIWRGMLKRCNPAKADRHPKYAGRGITVCDEWKSYVAFKAWATANGYADGLTIERRDNDGPYSPGNCTWITGEAQALNRRSTRRITYAGETLPLVSWAYRAGISQELLGKRISMGWPMARAINTPPNPLITGRPRRAA